MLSDNMMLGGGGRKAAYSMENSLLFRGGQYLSRTSTIVGDRQKFTLSFWVRLGDLTTTRQRLLGAEGAGGHFWIGYNDPDSYGTKSGFSFGNVTSTNVASSFGTTAAFRDPSAWYHIVFWWDSSNASDADRAVIYINGMRESVTWMTFGHEGCVTYEEEAWWCGIHNHTIGCYPANSSNFNGQLADIIHIDGALLPPPSFGEPDPVTGSWCPKNVSGLTYGARGFHLGKPWNSASLGMDYSGRGNNWEKITGFLSTDVVADTPTNVYATLNPLHFQYINDSTSALSDGNLTVATGTYYGGYYSTLAAPAGMDWGFEAKLNTSGHAHIGVSLEEHGSLSTNSTPTAPGHDGYSWALEVHPTYIRKWHNNVPTTLVGTASINDVYSVIVIGAGIWFCKNGVPLEGNPVAGTGASFTNLSGRLFSAQQINTAGLTWNFGQRAFAYPAAFPTTAKPLCTANMPATTGQTSGSFTGNANADGPCIYTGAVPETLTINSNVVTWGTHADKLATGFKIRSASASYNASSSNSWTATYNKKPTVGRNHVPANAQATP